jgi:hypothetical protein
MSLVRYSVSLEVIQNLYMPHQKVSQAQNGHSMVSRKKFIISELRLIEGRNIIYNVLQQMESVYTLSIFNCLNFLHLLKFLKIPCDLTSSRSRSRNSRRAAAADRGTVYTTQQK